MYFTLFPITTLSNKPHPLNAHHPIRVTLEYETHTIIDGYCQKCSYYETQEYYTEGLVYELSSDGTYYSCVS